ncbi:hypothetical protein PJE062_2035 [Pseudovibrio sp. JE062]|nr:hypothetical protein PJE062_2035 [Pseudovibrio sp. JE062]
MGFIEKHPLLFLLCDIAKNTPIDRHIASLRLLLKPVQYVT